MKESRARTVAMSNLFNDPDSLARRRANAESLVTKESMGSYAKDTTPGLLSTILHEATHNLGPTHEYVFKGKKDDEAFGGGLSSMLEELKAQTGALFFIGFLKDKGIITPELAQQTYMDSLTWTFGHISQGMWADEAKTKRKAYSQLAAIQLGFLLDEGAITFDKTGHAANGTDLGAFTIHFDKLPAAISKLMATVGRIKATNDKDGALALAQKYVEGEVVPHQAIVERYNRSPLPSLVYALDL